MIAPFPSRRLGRLSIDGNLVAQRPNEILALYATIIPLRIEFRAVENVFDVDAWSRHFDEVGPGEAIPLYAYAASEDTVRWTRIG